MVAPLVAAALVGGGASLLGGMFSNRSNKKAAERQEQIQREFAQSGVQWKVADAKKAGIHPLYALGASTSSYSPIAVQDSIGPAMSSAGQDIGRAMMASADQKTREEVAAKTAGYEAKVREEQLRGMQLDNQRRQYENLIIEQQWMDSWRRRIAAGVGPAGPGGNGGANGIQGAKDVKIVPAEQTAVDPLITGRAASRDGGGPGFVPMRIGTRDFGFTLDVPNSVMSEGFESLGWPLDVVVPSGVIGAHYAAKGLQSIKDKSSTRDELGPPRKGYHWKLIKGAWHEVPNRR